MKKFCYIGHFGGNESFREGQTVKTQNIADVLKTADDFCVKYVDTYYSKRNILKFGLQLIDGLFSCKRIILCVADGGRRAFFPLLYWCVKLFRKEVYHFLIGGRLVEETEERKKWNKYLQSFCINWVESHGIVEGLRKYGVTNAEYLPNFKKLPVVSCDDICDSQLHVSKFCVFSRITERKGITEAIESVAEINRKHGQYVAFLDLYGRIDPNYESMLKQLLAEHNAYVRYCGEAEPQSSVDVLRNYDILLFPTRRFYKEGIPGTIIDAFCAGVPVIARQWKYGHEMLTHGYNSYYYHYDEPEKLVFWMEHALNHPDEIYEMKKNCLISAEQYRAENVAPIILRKLAQ